MAVMDICVGKGLILALFFFAVDGRRSGPIAVDHGPILEPEVVERISGPLFIVTFPGVIESGSEATLCASLLKPQEKLTMTISLLDERNVITPLVQQSSRMAFHRCFSFQAPQVDGELLQKLQVEVKGRVFKVTEERKVMFRRYLPLTFIQTETYL
ncbi:ovostatin homolog 2-like [Sinocyclocheilus grahami]|uniref:ovostatin homolog 2-like n=1 Tax=Sinocyclocheilus grahami TaxID=75366 RepID=UPI0007AC764C|nr:PREDICTED: ovostatin homolog 2-like [Sinocyclocheilus grahami]